MNSGARKGRRRTGRSPRIAGGRVRRRAKTALACILVGVLLALPIPFANTVIGYAPVVAYLFVLLLSYVYLRLLKGRLSFEEEGVQGGCLRGEKLAFSLTVRNDSVLPAVSVAVDFFISDLFGGERESAVRHISLPPRSSKTFDFGVVFDHIGTYSVGIRRVDVSDPFGIFHHVKENGELSDIAVQPRICQIAPLEISTEAARESKRTVTTVIDDGMDYCGVREYRWGDPIKAIHWNLSAREPEGEYFTRLYETSSNPGVELFIDCDAPDYDAGLLMDCYDAVVESALSIERWASAAGYETELLFVDGAGGRRRFEGPLAGRCDDVLEPLPRISTGDGGDVCELVRSEAASIYSQSNLVVCSCSVTDELVGELISARANRRAPQLVAIVPRGAAEEKLRAAESRLSRLSAAGIKSKLVARASDLEEAL